MSKDVVEKKLDILINLMENLPKRIIEEMKKYDRIKDRLKDRVSIESNNLDEQNIADQLSQVYNHHYTEGK